MAMILLMDVPWLDVGRLTTGTSRTLAETDRRCSGSAAPVEPSPAHDERTGPDPRAHEPEKPHADADHERRGRLEPLEHQRQPDRQRVKRDQAWEHGL